MQHDAEKGDIQADASFRNVEPVDVRIHNVSVQFRPSPPPWKMFARGPVKGVQPKTVLADVAAHMPAGSLTAIIGGSGSGKTTMLNMVAHRVSSSKLAVTGAALFNGNPNLQSVRSAYVMQQDVLLPTLTVRETLRYSADLRLPPPATEEERRAVVERVILELGLKECADTRIGSSIHKGCSGGEKRRTSIGVQMLANPSVLFCDEPTTGLDAYSAFQVVQRLKQLAQNGRTIIMSIHAPRSEIWGLFDRVILLSGGATLFCGEAADAIPYFRKCGFPMPAFVNPAEFLIDLAAVDNRSESLEETSRKRVQALTESWTHENVMKTEMKASYEPKSAAFESTETHTSTAATMQTVSFVRQLNILTARTVKVTVRDPMGIAASLFEATALAVITGWIFLQLGTDLAGIRSREGSLYIAASIQGYLVLLFETYRMTNDIQLFDRERQEGVVSVLPFIVSRRLARLFLEDLPVPTIFSLIFYFMNGYRNDAATFFIFLVVMIINQYIAVTLASVSVSVARGFTGASLISNLSYTLQALACGFFVQVQQLPVYVRWMKWITYNFYVFSSLATNEFVGVDGGEFGQFYGCPSSNDPRDPACQQYVGVFITDSLGFPRNWIWRPIIIALSFPIFFFLLSWGILTFKKVTIDVASARKNQQDTYGGAEKFDLHRASEVRKVTVDLESYALDVQNRYLTKRSSHKTILRPVTASFEPGKINVIMGPSGSGKTSLLQSLAQRLESSWSSKYRASGTLLLNGAVPASNVMKSVASFVTQDDDALMAELTVRETLRFAAGLRLPSSMSKAEKLQRAEDVLLRMGLKDCADNVIGSDLKKGISGGEKRRVSIAVQILTDPKILLLDEPTSGLDAFTATSVIDVLTALAAEGRTIIMTIHQARSDIFPNFHNILLLARGGAQVYSGRGQDMLPYFRELGHECPETTNPADFVLDLITVDLQEETKEAASREKVGLIIDAWKQQQEARGTIRRSQSKIATSEELSSLQRRMNPFRITFPLVLHRSALQTFRNPEILMARTTQVIFVGGIFALFFAPLQTNYEAVQSRMGYIAEFGAFTFPGMLLISGLSIHRSYQVPLLHLRCISLTTSSRHVTKHGRVSSSTNALLPRALGQLLLSPNLPADLHPARAALHRHLCPRLRRLHVRHQPAAHGVVHIHRSVQLLRRRDVRRIHRHHVLHAAQGPHGLRDPGHVGHPLHRPDHGRRLLPQPPRLSAGLELSLSRQVRDRQYRAVCHAGAAILVLRRAEDRWGVSAGDGRAGAEIVQFGQEPRRQPRGVGSVCCCV